MKNKNLYFFGFCFFCLGEKDSAEAQEVEGGRGGVEKVTLQTPGRATDFLSERGWRIHRLCLACLSLNSGLDLLSRG